MSSSYESEYLYAASTDYGGAPSSFRGCGAVGELGEHFRLVSANADAPPPPLRFATVGSRYGRSDPNSLFSVFSKVLRSLRITSFTHDVFGGPATTTPNSVQPGPTLTISIRRIPKANIPPAVESHPRRPESASMFVFLDAENGPLQPSGCGVGGGLDSFTHGGFVTAPCLFCFCAGISRSPWGRVAVPRRA